MSSLHLFTQKKWFRRLWLIALGLFLGYSYAFDYITDIIFVPTGLGIIIGMLSSSVLMALINTVIVLISYIAGIVIFVLSGNLGSGQPVVWEYYQDLIANLFVVAATPMYCWIPALFIWLGLRYLMLKALHSRETQKS